MKIGWSKRWDKAEKWWNERDRKKEIRERKIKK